MNLVANFDNLLRFNVSGTKFKLYQERNWLSWVLESGGGSET